MSSRMVPVNIRGKNGRVYTYQRQSSGLPKGRPRLQYKKQLRNYISKCSESDCKTIIDLIQVNCERSDEQEYTEDEQEYTEREDNLEEDSASLQNKLQKDEDEQDDEQESNDEN